MSENSFAQSHTSRFLEPGSVVVFSMVPENVTAEIIKGISQVTGRTSVVYMKKVKTAEDAVTVVKRLRESSQLPQVFVCLGTKLSQAVKRELPDGTPPVVSLLSSKPKGDLFLNSSGIVLRYSSERTLGVLKELIPSVKKIGVLISSGASGRFSRELLHSIEKEFGFSLVLHEIADSADVAPGLASLIKDVDAIWLVQDRLVLKPDNVRYILGKALRARKPVLGLSPSYVKAGALFCLTQDFNFIGKELASRIGLLLEGKNDRTYSESKRAVIVVNKRILSLLKVPLPRDFHKGEFRFIK